MVFRIHCEMATAFVLLMATLIYYNQKHLRTYQNSYFKLLLVFSVSTCLLDAMRVVSDHYAKSPMVGEIIYIVYILVYFGMALSFSVYALTTLNRWDIVHKTRCAWLLVYGFYAISAILTPWTRWMFYPEQKGFAKTPLYISMYVVSLLFLLLPFVVRMRGQFYSSRRKQLWILGTPMVLIASKLLQKALIPDITIFYIVECLIVFCYMLFLQNSDYYIDEATGFFKMHGFEAVIREKLTYQQPCSILLIRIMNYNAMTEMYDDAKLVHIQRAMAKLMLKECGNRDFYHIAASTFAVISNSREDSEWIHSHLLQKLPKVWTLDNDKEEIVHEYYYYQMSLPEECDNMADLAQRVSYARSDHKSHHLAGELIPLTAEVIKHARDKQMVADLVEQAINDNSIEIYFQPIYSLEKGKVTSLEVLSRLKDKDKNFINPEFFIHVAEEDGDILQLGEQIYRKACIFATQNNIFDLGIEDININLSPVQCCYEELADDLIRIAQEYGIPMSRMHLEITESGIMDKEEIWETLETLRSSGAKIALDDFGTGYSNISSIVTLPVDFVKIDKSLVWSYGRGENKYLDQLVPMIHAEGKRIISEGIETQEHIDIFKRLHGDFLQGYFYSKPLPEQEFIRYLRKANEIL